MGGILGTYNRDSAGSDTGPRALELKAGMSHTISKKCDVFGTLAWVAGDLDIPQDDDLRNYVGC